MCSIINSDAAPHHLKQLREWFVAEWRDMDSFELHDVGPEVPSPLLVIDGPELLGGLAFSSYPTPGSEELGLWINGLIVAPEHRRKGLGSRLIKAAEFEAIGTDAHELYVYTSIPDLYRRLGWEKIDGAEEDTVLRKPILSRQY